MADRVFDRKISGQLRNGGSSRRASWRLASLLLGWCLASPLHAEEAKEVSFDEHVKPILREHCWGCHKQGSAQSGLALDSFAGITEGGSSGEVVVAGDLDSSRLWQLINHLDEPSMPPNGPKLPDPKLAVIRDWIMGGMLDKPGGTRQQKATGLAGMEAPQIAAGEPGPMPAGLPRQPVNVTPHAGAVPSIAASPNAPLLAVAGQHQILLYHMQQKNLIGIIPFADGTPSSLRFSLAGDWLIVAGGQSSLSGRVTIYDVASGSWLGDFGEDSDTWLTADMSPDRQFIAAGGPTRVVHVVNIASGETITTLKRHTDWVQCVAYSPAGNYLASGDRGGGLWIWELPNHQELAPCNGHNGGVTGVDWRPDGKALASCGDDGTVRLWDPANGRQLKSWNAHPGGALSVRFARDGRLVSVGRDQHAKLWDANGTLVKDFGTHGDIVLACAISSDLSVVASADWLGNLHFWNVADDHSLSVSTNPPSLQSLASTSTQQVAAAAARLQQANHEMELITSARQQLQARFDPMLKQALALETSTGGEQPPAEESDSVLRTLGELTVERELLDQREPAGRAAVDAAQQELQQAEQQLQQINQELAAFDQLEAQLTQQLQQATAQVETLQQQWQQRRGYQQHLQQALEAAQAALSVSGDVKSPEENVGVLQHMATELSRLLEADGQDAQPIEAALQSARVEQQRAEMRLKLFQLRIHK